MEPTDQNLRAWVEVHRSRATADGDPGLPPPVRHALALPVKPGGRVVILEFNRPRPVWYRPFVDFYLFHILPRLGGLFSRQEAYTYLPRSVDRFVTPRTLEIATD